MTECKYLVAWVGRCRAETVEGEEYCTEHLLHEDNKDIDRWNNLSKCCVCGGQAIEECGQTMGGFVCGSPLCDKPECIEKHGHGTGY